MGRLISLRQLSNSAISLRCSNGKDRSSMAVRALCTCRRVRSNIRCPSPKRPPGLCHRSIPPLPAVSLVLFTGGATLLVIPICFCVHYIIPASPAGRGVHDHGGDVGGA